MPRNVDVRLWMSSVWIAALWCLFTASQVVSHEIQPSVADIVIGPDSVDITLEMTLEAPVARIDLDGLFDTNDAENAAEYDRLRALGPGEMGTALSEFWPEFREKITLRAGDEDLDLMLDASDIPDVGDPEVSRLSKLKLSADLPEGAGPITIGWTADLGALAVRQMGVEEGYTDYLTGGALSQAIPHTGGGAMGAFDTFVRYIVIGFEHIIPKGLDHILFVLGLFFLSLQLRPLLWQVTAFTLAHTVTLALGILGYVSIPGSVVEPLIAASIVYVGVENVLSKGLTPWRPVVVFCFGLLHGLGFASVLGDIGLDPAQFVTGLIAFNIGVEFGQLAVILVAFLLVGLWFRNKPWYKARIANPASLLIAAIGAYWVIERTLL